MSKLARTPFLATNSITKAYGKGGHKLHVLKGISLRLSRGDSLMILGPSGAGKSTLLHILGLLDTPTSGIVSFEGQDLTALSPRRQARLRNELFGFVFQFFHLLPDFSALENVLMPAMVREATLVWPSRRKAAKQRALELLERVGLADRMRHRPSQMSGGERQRVAICRALMNEPRVLLLDEPTGNVDSKTGQEIMDLIRELNETMKQTFVMVTHDPSLTDRASRTIHVRDGLVTGH
jgi:lipoprotein-releasing system ATP-binding protein